MAIFFSKNLKKLKHLQYNYEQLIAENLKLQLENAELLRSNKELSSFNYIASHDLQDPLRKIQIFISKIFYDKDLVLSEKNQDYFKRLQLSANRMQKLIDNLLSYSFVNDKDKIFERTSLNTTLDDILNDISNVYVTDENNATINYKSLPDVRGIPHQLKQLFTNLISNSIKYRAPNRVPIIDINSTIVDGKDIFEDKADKNKSYYKITVADNGMGFEQEYAEKIFMLFQRLHDKNTYSGTGIGLSICRKIVENHQGFITATSAPDKGTTFIIYLPILEE